MKALKIPSAMVGTADQTHSEAGGRPEWVKGVAEKAARPGDDERREQRLMQESRERMLAKGWDLSWEAIRRIEDLMNDGMPMTGDQAKLLAVFLDVVTERTAGTGRHRA